MNQIGLSAQRPLWRAYQPDPQAVQQWLEKDYPAIRGRAKREGAQIFFADEAGVRSDYHSGTTWGRRGQTPIVSSTGARFGANLISAVSARGHLRFMLTKGRVTAAVFIEFLRRLLVNASSPVFVIVDGHPTHKAKSVERYVTEQGGRLALFVLPPYSPELNPDEFVWADLKAHRTGRKLITSLTQLRHTVMAHLRQLQKLPELVRSFFHAPYTRYARI
jgi:transposase